MSCRLKRAGLDLDRRTSSPWPGVPPAPFATSSPLITDLGCRELSRPPLKAYGLWFTSSQLPTVRTPLRFHLLNLVLFVPTVYRCMEDEAFFAYTLHMYTHKHAHARTHVRTRTQVRTYIFFQFCFHPKAIFFFFPHQQKRLISKNLC